MEYFEMVLRALIIKEGIDYNDIIKAIEDVAPDYILDEILDELCSYVDPYLTPDDVFRSSNI